MVPMRIDSILPEVTRDPQSVGSSHDALTRRDRHPGVKSILPGDADKWLSSMTSMELCYI